MENKVRSTNVVVVVEEDLSDREYVIEQFKVFYDVYAIFKERLINDFKKQLLDYGWTMARMTQMEMEAVERSNWSKNSFLEDEVRRNGKDKPYQTTYLRK